MNSILKHLSVFLFTQLVITQTSLHAAEPRDTMPDTWAATDALGRTLPMSAEVGGPKANRTAAMKSVPVPNSCKATRSRCARSPVPLSC